MPTEGEVVARWPRVGRSALLRSVELTSFETPSLGAAADLIVDQSAAVDALPVTFRAALHGAIAHTLDPWT